MRAGSLSTDLIKSRLRNKYVCGYRNIAKEPYSGNSGVHPISGAAADTTNGAGPRNLQLFVLAPDSTVLHCLPGYWNAYDLDNELKLAERLMSIWQDTSITPVQKQKLFAREHLSHMQAHPSDMVERSKLQGFDKVHIFKHQKETGDAIKEPDSIAQADVHDLPDEAFKTTDQIMHERLSRRPFLTYAGFDTANYVNYGSSHYDRGEHEYDPDAERMAKHRNLREVLHETWKPEDPKPKVAAAKAEPVKPAKPKERDLSWNDLMLLKDLDKNASKAFWSYMKKQQWD
ncbi:MAG: hypothetical protein K2Z81_27430, partial [Cyanobacteria bacterium]|nr:hypothetical protein [Cyanobacteriota bacterium]